MFSLHVLPLAVAYHVVVVHAVFFHELLWAHVVHHVVFNGEEVGVVLFTALNGLFLLVFGLLLLFDLNRCLGKPPPIVSHLMLRLYLQLFISCILLCQPNRLEPINVFRHCRS